MTSNHGGFERESCPSLVPSPIAKPTPHGKEKEQEEKHRIRQIPTHHPKGKVATAYGIYNDESGMSKRAAFVIDKEGIVRFSKVYSGGLPDVEELLAELDKLG